MHLIDTHAHLYLPQFEKDRREVVLRAINQGVETILLPNIDPSTIRSLLDLHRLFPEHCLPMMGLHPGSVNQSYREALGQVGGALLEGAQEYIAVGEVGIDLYWDQSFLREQTEAFQEQVQWSLDMDLPLVIHSRDSFDQIHTALMDFRNQPLKGVFHSFTGGVEQAKKVMDLGFYIGINGIVTFKNAALGHLVEKIGLKSLILETDAPYLTPDPHRGKRNESSYLVHIARKVAEYSRVDYERVVQITTRNAIDLFNLKKPN